MSFTSETLYNTHIVRIYTYMCACIEVVMYIYIHDSLVKMTFTSETRCNTHIVRIYTYMCACIGRYVYIHTRFTANCQYDTQEESLTHSIAVFLVRTSARDCSTTHDHATVIVARNLWWWHVARKLVKIDTIHEYLRISINIYETLRNHLHIYEHSRIFTTIYWDLRTFTKT
jgi:hypothetical protein